MFRAPVTVAQMERWELVPSAPRSPVTSSHEPGLACDLLGQWPKDVHMIRVSRYFGFLLRSKNAT